MGIFNFAHGAIYMAGAYSPTCYPSYSASTRGHRCLISVIVVGAAGVPLEKYCFRPYLGRPERQIVMAIALILILENGIM